MVWIWSLTELLYPLNEISPWSSRDMAGHEEIGLCSFFSNSWFICTEVNPIITQQIKFKKSVEGHKILQ